MKKLNTYSVLCVHDIVCVVVSGDVVSVRVFMTLFMSLCQAMSCQYEDKLRQTHTLRRSHSLDGLSPSFHSKAILS